MDTAFCSPGRSQRAKHRALAPGSDLCGRNGFRYLYPARFLTSTRTVSRGEFYRKGYLRSGSVHRVLDRRFPRNSLLSHDLLEGAYARAGLVSDIEVIEDYPSHYSAYNRRKHRWLRGDWQIAGWLLPHVPEESVDRVANPISLAVVVEDCRQFAPQSGGAGNIFLAGRRMVHAWQPWLWTLVTLGILFIPAWVEFGFNLLARSSCGT